MDRGMEDGQNESIIALNHNNRSKKSVKSEQNKAKLFHIILGS